MPCSTNTLTGRNGKFVCDGNLVARVTQWAVNPTMATSSEWGDSDSGGYTQRAAGRKDATFTAEGKFASDDAVYSLFGPGDNLECVLWMNNTSLFWDFPCALCTDFNLTVNIDTEEVIGWTSEWGADGIYYPPGTSPNSHTVP